MIKLEENLSSYRSNYTTVVAISISMVYSFFLKVLFNACTKSFSKGDKVGYDKWAILDITSAIATLIIFPFMANSPAQVFLDKETKAFMDYVVSALIILQLTRFFSFMLLVLEMSKLLLTVYAMLIDTVPFVLPFRFQVSVNFIAPATELFQTCGSHAPRLVCSSSGVRV